MFRFLLLLTFFSWQQNTLFAQVQDTCYLPTAKVKLDANNARVTFSLMGYLWSDIDTINERDGSIDYSMKAGYEIPKVNEQLEKSVHSLFSGGFWIAGLDNKDSIRLAKTTYAYGYEDFRAGPIDINGQTNFATCNAYDRYWKVHDSTVQIQINNYVYSNFQDIPLANIPTEILEWPAKGNPYAKGKNGQSLNISQDLAPFVDVDSNGIYNPVKGDFPDIRGDQHIFWVYNDLGDNRSGLETENIGLEIHANAFAYQSDIEAINNATFYSFTFHARDTADLHNMYIGIHVDNDLGCFNNDFVGCDTSRNMGIAYNGEKTDADCASPGYGVDPPILGLKILDNLACKTDPNRLTKMQAFKYYNKDASLTGKPNSKEDFYNYLQGLWKDGTAQTYGGNGYGGSSPTKYMFSGNPIKSNAWSECSEGISPADRRFVISLGPFGLKSGAYKKIDFSVVWTRPDSFLCGDFNSTIGLAADQAQDFYDSVICPPREMPIVSSIPSAFQENILSVYPNPFQDKIYVHLNKTNADFNIELVDISGKILKSYTQIPSEKTFVLPTAELSSGIYFLQISNENELLEVRKLIKTSN